MARYDTVTGSNWLTKKEKLIRKSVNFFFVFCLIDFVLLFFKPIRNYHFSNFPNLHFVGIVLLFLMVIIRILQAQKEGTDPYMEASRAWRERKGMLESYDYMGPGPDYSNKIYNLIYYIVVLISFGLIILEAI